MGKVHFDGGGTRSDDWTGVRYDLITPVGLRRLAARYALGSKQHGERNWMGGFPISDVLNHALAHLVAYLDGDRSDDHLAAAAWGCLTATHFEERRRDLDDVPVRSADEFRAYAERLGFATAWESETAGDPLTTVEDGDEIETRIEQG